MIVSTIGNNTSMTLKYVHYIIANSLIIVTLFGWLEWLEPPVSFLSLRRYLFVSLN